MVNIKNSLFSTKACTHIHTHMVVGVLSIRISRALELRRPPAGHKQLAVWTMKEDTKESS